MVKKLLIVGTGVAAITVLCFGRDAASYVGTSIGWVEESGRDAGFGPAAGAAIVVLLVFVVLMNSVAVFLRNHFEKKRA